MVPIDKGSLVLNRLLDGNIVLPKGIFDFRCCQHPEDDEEQPKSLPDRRVDDGRREELARECKCECDDSCQEPSHHCLCIRPYIADLLIVKEDLARYEKGDVAYIENILAGESKTRKHINKVRTEEETERETESSVTEEKDLQVTEKHSLKDEVSKTVSSEVNVDAGISVTAKYGRNVTIKAHANVAGEYSKFKAQSAARNYARDLVQRSVSKVEEKVRNLEVSRVITERKEKNIHVIDNEDGSHRAGIFFWVNKVTRAQVLNQDKHMMLDLIVSEPAALFKKLYKLNQVNIAEENKPPKEPEITIETINRTNYAALLAEHGITKAEVPPNEFAWIEMGFSHSVTPDGGRPAGFSESYQSPQVPEGYRCTQVIYEIHCSTGHPKGTGPKDEVAINVTVGQLELMSEWINEYRSNNQKNQNWTERGLRNMANEEGVITVAASGLSSLSLGLTGTLSFGCQLTDEAENNWRKSIYDLIMEDYQRKLRDHEAQEDARIGLIDIKGRNPFLNREIERNELKRHIIAILMCNYFSNMGSMIERVQDCGYPEINFQKLEKDAPYIQFFEQVVEWRYINYLFYHSMWARKCKWPELIDEDSGDPLFDKFLMSGAAQVQVPIRHGMEEIFNWFLRTGEIWGEGGEPPVFGDDEYVSMIQELKESKQGDYSDREGLVTANNGDNKIELSQSTYYWDAVQGNLHQLNIDNDVDREIVLNCKIYRIVSVTQTTSGVIDVWTIELDRPYEDTSATNMKYSVGAVFVGAPWEVDIPTKLVYLQNPDDPLPVYLPK